MTVERCSAIPCMASKKSTLDRNSVTAVYSTLKVLRTLSMHWIKCIYSVGQARIDTRIMSLRDKGAGSGGHGGPTFLTPPLTFLHAKGWKHTLLVRQSIPSLSINVTPSSSDCSVPLRYGAQGVPKKSTLAAIPSPDHQIRARASSTSHQRISYTHVKFS